ncbi:hypothetical protein KHQ88_06305 [Mycoplasmatota bacterium]|nr:hypothetical protein KHQ88_06305 [Mycoplasmatota bacterium]
MKKIALLVFTVFLISMSSMTVSANTSDNSSENSFAKTVLKNIIAQEYDIDHMDKSDLSLRKEVIYNFNIEKYGSIYEFEYKDNFLYGYMILSKKKIDSKWEYHINEISFESKTPYFDLSAKNVYLSYGNYLEYKNGVLVDSYSRLEYNYQEMVDYVDFIDIEFPSGGVEQVQEPETFNYCYYTSDEVTTNFGFPLLHTGSYLQFNQSNNCAPTAGTEITLFFDAWEPSLVEDVDPLFYNGSIQNFKGYDYFYVNPYSTEKPLIANLERFYYDDMETNSWGADLSLILTGPVPSITYVNTGIGTLPTKFYDSLYNYFYSKGLILHSVPIIESENSNFGYVGESMSDSDNWTVYKQQIDYNRPVVMQLGLDWSFDYTLLHLSNISLDNESGIGSYKYSEYPPFSAHVVVGYGYKTFSYYQCSNGNYPWIIREDEFMIVANGWGKKSYINIEDNDIGVAYGLYITHIGSC